MRILKYIGLCCFFVVQTASSQTIIDLHEPATGTQTHTARDTVVMGEGFEFNASTGGFLANVDKTQVGDPLYIGNSPNYDESAPDRVLDKSLHFGSLPGSINVSPTGSANYQIPLSIPAGIMDMQPDLSFVYSSSGGDGYMGIGWSLSCSSAITRTGKDRYHDGIQTGLLLSDDDPLSFDGMRLICKDAGFKGLAGTNFGAEVENNNIITKSGDGFIVQTIDGKTMEYGIDPLARFEASNGVSNSVISWFVNKVTDANGNYLTYKYAKNIDNGEIYLQAIEYTGTQDILPSHKIQLLYMERSDKWTGFLLDNKISRTVLLEKVEIYTKNIYRGSYDLKYNNDNYVTQLTEVSQSNAEGEKINPTVFKWTKPEFTGITNNVNGIETVANAIDEYLPGDYNNDGYTDMVVYRRINFIPSSYTGHNLILSNTDEHYSYAYEHKLIYYKGSSEGLNFVDEIDVPRSDFFNQFIEDGVYGFYSYMENYTTCISHLTGSLENNIYPLRHYLKDIMFINSGDYNGDGQLEICIGIKNLDYPSTDGLKCNLYGEWEAIEDYFDAGSNHQYPSLGYSAVSYSYFFANISQYGFTLFNNDKDNYDNPLPSFTSTVKVDDAVIDHNQDGKTDLKFLNALYNVNADFSDFVQLQGPNYTQLYEFLNQDLYIIDGTTEFIYENKMQPIDFNGDGLIDYARLDKFDHVNRGIFTKNLDGTYAEVTPTYKGRFNGVTDFNSDGRSEIITVLPNTVTRTVNYSDVYYYPCSDSHCRFEDIPEMEDSPEYNVGDLIYDVPPTGTYRLYTIYPSGFDHFSPDPNTRINDIKVEITETLGYTVEFHDNKTFNVESTSPIFHEYIQAPEPYLLSIDVNGDRLPDLLYVEQIKFNTSKTLTQIWINKGCSSGSPIYDKITLSESINLGEYYDIGDYNGDGNLDLLCAGGIKYFNLGKSGYKLAEVSDGLNNQIQISYDNLNNSLVYEKESGFTCTYPITNVKFPFYVVNEIKQSTALRDANKKEIWGTTAYYYKNLLVHLDGKGFLGFEKFRTTNISDNIQQTQIFEIQEPFYNLALKRTDLERTDINNQPTGEIISTVINTNNISNLGNLQYRSYISQINIDDKLKDIETQTNNYYDNNGDLVRRIAETQDVKSEQSYSYTNIGNSNIFKKIDEKINTIAYNGQPTYTNSTKYTYDSFGNLHTQVEFANTSEPINTTYSNYNNIGLPGLVEITASGISANRSIINYDDYGRVLSKTNVLGHTSNIKYDKITGNIISQEDHLGNISYVNYDNWGELIETTNLLGSKTYTIQGWAEQPSKPANAIYFKSTYSENSSIHTTYFDSKRRELKNEGLNTFGVQMCSEKSYNDKGQLIVISEPHFVNESPRFTTFEYDEYGRKKSILTPTSTTTISYNGKETTSTVNGKTVIKSVNSLGDILIASDAGGNSIIYTYHSSGQPLSITTAGTTITFEYDEKGNQTKLIDANSGITDYEYDAIGRLIKQTDALGSEFNMTYDTSGRLLTKTSSNNESESYSYFPNGLLDYVEHSEDQGYHKRYFNYDNYGRMLSQTDEIAAGESYTSTYLLNDFDQVIQKTYPSGFQIKYEYSAHNGDLIRVKKSDGSLIWELQDTNSKGQITSIKWGNNLQNINEYDNNGFLIRQSVNEGIFDMQYSYNTSTGNLFSRQDNITVQQEEFEYDNFDRLTSIYPYSIDDKSITYDINGNITSKYDAGTYEYNDANHPHAISGITGNTSIPSLEQNIVYNSIGKLESINEGLKSLNIRYNADGERIEGKWYDDGILVRTKKYLDDYEIEIVDGVTKESHYIYTPSGLAAVMIRNGSIDNLNYICTDHLGSVAVMLEENGSVAERRSFDAWGRERDPYDWNSYIVGKTIFDRGYTGHEYLIDFGIVNMNGRVYDPILGRFLSPDNYIQDPFNSQSYNRYSYCLNNPLIYSDPSGEFWNIIIGAAIGGGVNWAMNGAEFTWDGLGAFAIGNVAGALTAVGGTGNIIAAGYLSSFNNAILAGSDNPGLAGAYGAASAVWTSFLPSLNISYGEHFSGTISPTVNFGKDGASAGININPSASIGGNNKATIGFNYGVIFGINEFTGKSGIEQRLSASVGYEYTPWDARASLSSSQFWSGETSQRTGMLTIGYGKTSFSYENDGFPFSGWLGDGGDSYRTAAARLSYGDYYVGFQLFTGYREYDDVKYNEPGYPYGKVNNPEISKYNSGVLYVGYKNYRAGWNSDGIRHAIQNRAAHSPIKIGNWTIKEGQAWIPRQGGLNESYGSYTTTNPYTLW